MLSSMKEKNIQLDLKKTIDAGKTALSNGADIIKKGAAVAKDGIVHGAMATKSGVSKGVEIVAEKTKNAQISVLNYVDSKKNQRFLAAKLSAFEDGLKEGKVQATDYIKRYSNFCLATTALSFYFARCDGSIDEAEMLEIQFDLDAILKNKDLPDALKNEMSQISQDDSLTFDKVAKYLDGVGNDTLLEFKKDIDEIIFADNIRLLPPEAFHMTRQDINWKTMSCSRERTIVFPQSVMILHWD